MNLKCLRHRCFEPIVAARMLLGNAMADVNKYWLGKQQAYVPDYMIDASWARGDGAGNRLRACSMAPSNCITLLKKAIDSCPNSEMQSAMGAELTSAGTAGFYQWGVTCMDDAFQHWMKPGNWQANDLKTYMKANGILGGRPQRPGGEVLLGPADQRHAGTGMRHQLLQLARFQDGGPVGSDP